MQVSMKPLTFNQHGQPPTSLAWNPYGFALFQQYSDLHMPPTDAHSSWAGQMYTPPSLNSYSYQHLHGLHPPVGHASSIPVAGRPLTGNGYTNFRIKSGACQTPCRQDDTADGTGVGYAQGDRQKRAGDERQRVTVIPRTVSNVSGGKFWSVMTSLLRLVRSSTRRFRRTGWWVMRWGPLSSGAESLGALWHLLAGRRWQIMLPHCE